MNLVLDASMVLAWVITRSDPNEAAIAQQALSEVQLASAYVPALWYAEVANALLVFERAKRLSIADSASFLADLATLAIDQDETSVELLQPHVISAARLHRLTAYDATYFELAMRRRASLATFDRQLADAYRQAGGYVYGD